MPPVGNPPKPGKPAGPPLRQPIGKGTWLMVMLALVAIWIVAKPGNPYKKLESRVDAALALTADCKMTEARAELSDLRSSKASAAQLKRLQDAINTGAPVCEKQRGRAKAWADARGVIEAALDAGQVDKAGARLAAHIKRWGDKGAEADELREWDGRIDARKGTQLLDEAEACLARANRVCVESKLPALEKLKRPELEARTQTLRAGLSRLLETTMLEQGAANGAPVRSGAPAVISTAPAVAQNAQQARKVLGEAERELAQGNYKSAMEKAELCATMVDVGNRACIGVKLRAERLNREMLRCIANGSDWIGDRCQ